MLTILARTEGVLGDVEIHEKKYDYDYGVLTGSSYVFGGHCPP